MPITTKMTIQLSPMTVPSETDLAIHPAAA
jgi:hypothetical protein